MMRCVMLTVASLVLEFALATPAHADKGVHLVGTTSDGGFWHTIADSDGRMLPFEDVLQRTGTPWTSHFPDSPFRAAIADIAVQPIGHNNDLLVLVLIEYHCVPPLLSEDAINPCLRRQAPPEARTQVWQTFRNSAGQWGRFVNVTAQLGGLVFTRIALARISFALIYFCGATDEGDVALFNINTYQGLMWQNPRTLKSEAQFDPGPATAVSCTDTKFSATLSVAMIANGNVYSTFLSLDGSNKAYKDQSFSEIGIDNLTARIGIPESVEDVDAAATYGYRELHLIVGAPGMNQYHSVTDYPFFGFVNTEPSWAAARNLSALTGHPERVVATAVANLNYDLHLYNVTDDGEIWETVRQSTDGMWTGVVRLKQTAGDVGRFTQIAVAYFDDSPEYAVLRLNAPTNVRVENVKKTSFQLSYLNNSDYADRILVKMKGPNSLNFIARTGIAVSVPSGVRGVLLFDDSSIIHGARYAVSVQVSTVEGASENSEDLFFTTESDLNEIEFRISGGRNGVIVNPPAASPFLPTDNLFTSVGNQIYWQLCNAGTRPQAISMTLDLEFHRDFPGGGGLFSRWCDPKDPSCRPTVPDAPPIAVATCDPHTTALNSCTTDSWPEADSRIVAPGICVWQRFELNPSAGCWDFGIDGVGVSNPSTVSWICENRQGPTACQRLPTFAPPVCIVP